MAPFRRIQQKSTLVVDLLYVLMAISASSLHSHVDLTHIAGEGGEHVHHLITHALPFGVADQSIAAVNPRRDLRFHDAGDHHVSPRIDVQGVSAASQKSKKASPASRLGYPHVDGGNTAVPPLLLGFTPLNGSLVGSGSFQFALCGRAPPTA